MIKNSCFLGFLLTIFLKITLSPLQAQTLTEHGLLREVEEVAHPLLTLTIEFPQRDFSETFMLNTQDIPYIDARKLSHWKGKYVNFDYTSDTYTSLVEITAEGKSVFLNNAKKPKTGGNLRNAMGVLTNAHTETTGNIPTIIYITTREGTILPFECFVTREMVAVNGTNVLVTYNETVENIIRVISLKK